MNLVTGVASATTLTGISGPRGAIMRLAYLVDLSLGNTAVCVNTGPLGETRDEFLHIYSTAVSVIQSVKGDAAAALVVTPAIASVVNTALAANPALAAQLSAIGILASEFTDAPKTSAVPGAA